MASWNKPSDGGSTILSYTIKQYGSEYSALNDIDDSTDPQYATYEVDGNDTTYPIYNLTTLLNYWFRIYAINSIGNSVLSDVVGPIMPLPPMLPDTPY
jgi:hypothetical protein